MLRNLKKNDGYVKVSYLKSHAKYKKTREEKIAEMINGQDEKEALAKAQAEMDAKADAVIIESIKSKEAFLQESKKTSKDNTRHPRLETFGLTPQLIGTLFDRAIKAYPNMPEPLEVQLNDNQLEYLKSCKQ